MEFSVAAIPRSKIHRTAEENNSISWETILLFSVIPKNPHVSHTQNGITEIEKIEQVMFLSIYSLYLHTFISHNPIKHHLRPF